MEENLFSLWKCKNLDFGGSISFFNMGVFKSLLDECLFSLSFRRRFSFQLEKINQVPLSSKTLITALKSQKHVRPSVRKQHNAGYKHKANVRAYYQQFEEQQTQSLIDQRIKEHLGQTAAFQQVGAAYNQHLLAQRPRLPVLPTPVECSDKATQFVACSLILHALCDFCYSCCCFLSGYVSAPAMPQMLAPPGASSLPGQVSGPRPPMGIPPTTVPGSTPAPAASSGAPSMAPSNYQANPAAPTSGGFDSFNNAPAPEANH
ncbi:hypothetical protein GH714_024238 [Hevea brasiliensis]|uniref:U1-C C2H2-type zinc finger domain-containing protein n=1 Tax=Hevea brasiliensis TaxID=3981 RepID=A0A6A6LAX2_HEVBR|nr:hypothetical protein GH714_024238 [Hevea brasiliensis]